MKKLMLSLFIFGLNSYAQEAINIPSLYQNAVENGGEYRVLHATRFLRLSSLQEKGAKFPWQFVERVKGHKGAVFVVAVTENNELILGQQRRVPVQAQVLGLPGGMIGDKNELETVEEVAKRELLEETGYQVELDQLELVNKAPSSAGLTNEMHHVVLAKVAAIHYQQTDLEDAERFAGLRPVLIKLDEIEKVLEKKKEQGVLIDNKIYLALHFLQQYQAQKRELKKSEPRSGIVFIAQWRVGAIEDKGGLPEIPQVQQRYFLTRSEAWNFLNTLESSYFGHDEKIIALRVPDLGRYGL